MENLIRDNCIAFAGDSAHPTAGAFGTGSAFAFSDAWALYRSLYRTHASRPATIASPINAATSIRPCSAGTSTCPEIRPVAYNVPYALHLYNETRRHFLKRVENQISLDKLDIEYCAQAIDDYDEYVRRYRETFTINWWLLEHDVDAQFQEVEAQERHNYDLGPSRVQHTMLRADTTNANHNLQVVIVGGGIGGLAASIAIALAGHSVTVLEMADKIQEVRSGFHSARSYVIVLMSN